MVDLVAKLKLDKSKFSKGTTEATSDIIKFSDKAKKAIDQIANSFTNAELDLTQLQEKTEASSQQQTQSWSRVSKAIGGIALASGGMFKAMVDASPSLSAAFAEMNFMFTEMFMVLGEQLAPVIEKTLLPAVESLTNFIISLDTETQTWIASIIGLIALGSGVASFLSIFGIGLGFLLGPIGLVILAFAALAIAYKTNFLGIGDGIDNLISHTSGALKLFVGDHAEQIGRIVGLFQDMWNVIGPILIRIGQFIVENVVNQLKFLVDVALIVVDQFLDIFEGMLKIIKGIFTLDFGLIMEGFEGMIRGTFENVVRIIMSAIDLIGGMLRSFGGLFSGLIDDLFGIDIGSKLGAFPEFLKSMINMISGFINEFILSPIDSALTKLSELVDKIPLVSNPHLGISYRLPMFHGGGVVPGAIGQEVNITALGGEVISNPMRGQTPADVVRRDGGGISGKTSNFTFIFNNPQFSNRASRNSLINETETKFRRTLALYPSGR